MNTGARYGEDYLRYGDGTIYRGPRSAVPETAAGVVLPLRRSVVLRFYDTDGLKFYEASSDSGNQTLARGDFEVTPNGPGSGSFTLLEHPAGITHGTRVDLHLWGLAAPVWSGWVQGRPAAGRWAWPYDFRAFGFFSQLDWPHVGDHTWTTERVWEIVDEVVRTYVEPRTQVLYSAGAISALAKYKVQEMRARIIPAKKLLDQLSSLAGTFEFGVGPDRQFFFRPETAEVLEHWWLGKHFAAADPDEDSSRIVNRLWVQHGKRSADGDNYLALPLEDVASQRTHGIREGVFRAPSVFNQADAYRAGSVELKRQKDPTVRLPVRGLEFDGTPILCRGFARVVSEDGSQEYVLQKKRVHYRITPERVSVDVDLGERIQDGAAWFSELAATQSRLELVQQMTNRQIAL